jgi:hypothetical protein
MTQANPPAEIAGLVAELRARYKPMPIPPCRVCGAELSLSSAGGGSYPKYNCSALGMDFGPDATRHYAASEHFHDPGDANVVALLDALTLLSADNARLREAVEPFAKAADWMSRGNYPDDARPDPTMSPTYGDYRRAARAVAALPHKDRGL